MDFTVGILLSTLQIGIVKSSIVSTGFGDIIGETATVNIDNTDFHVDTYLGIPYAKAPVDNLRFSKPVPLDALNSPFNATQYSSACWQFTTYPVESEPPQSEDCLYLNVFVPQINHTNGKYAVLVYIHGGGFELGSSDVFDGKYLSAYGGIIVVTFNYRLGFLGFVQIDDIDAPSNVGLWDQRLVFEWVNNNIEAFGGDREKVTLLGASYGGISATIHALYPNNTGLFQRVMVHGGCLTTMEFNLQSGNTKEMDYVLKSIGCNSNSPLATLDRLRKIPASNLTTVVKKYSLEIRSNMLRDHFYVPIIDGTLIKWNPRNSTQEDEKSATQSLGFFKSLDFLNGFSIYDAGAIFQRLLKIVDSENFRPSSGDMEKIIESALRIIDNTSRSASYYIDNFVISEYTDWEDPTSSDSIRIQVVNLYTDILRAIPAVQLNKLHQPSSNSSLNNFMFLFSAKPSFHVLPTPSWLDGANHADELLYLSVIDQIPFAKLWEKDLSYHMMKYWSNFVKTGNPNGEEADSSNIPSWPRYSLEKQEYINLDRNITARAFLKARAADFWLNLFPELLDEQKKEECPECPCTTSRAPSARQHQYLFHMQMLATLYILLCL